MIIGGPISKETAGDLLAGCLLLIWLGLMAALCFVAGALALWLLSLLFSLL